MRGNPGTLARMPDGRLVVIYNRQPLLKEKGKIVVYLLDEQFNKITENGKPKTLLFDVQVYNEIIQTWKACGKVD